MKAPHTGRGEAPRAQPQRFQLRRDQSTPKGKKSGRFETLVRRYYSGVYSFASRLTDDPVRSSWANARRIR